MSTITTKDGTQIYYKGWGTGQPVAFSHGWPLSADSWNKKIFCKLYRNFSKKRVVCNSFATVQL
jgi:non-heme chloroperoxidase